MRSRDVGDVEALVRSLLDRADRDIVVAGGDGSIHEAVNGIMTARNTGRLGIVPSGTGNDFAKACGIPLDWKSAAESLAERIAGQAPSRRIDVGRVNERYFANGVGIGFDAKVTRDARSLQWPIGDLVYLVAIFRCMIDGIVTPEIEVVSDVVTWRGPMTLASISNGPWVGGMFHIAPMASNDDGKLELVIADPVSRLRILALLPRLIRGRHLGSPEITHASVVRLEIRAAAPVPSHLDGEVQPLATRFEIELLPGALEII